MSTKFRTIGVLAIMALAVNTGTARANENAYTLNPGDQLDISVWKEEGLQREVLVLPDGTISFPLVGQLSVRGQTVMEVQKEIATRIKPFVPEAAVTVSVRNAVGNKVYVLGQVRTPGEYSVSRRVSVTQALSMAGGLTAYAGENDIRVLRKRDGKEDTVTVRLGEIKRGRALDTDILLHPGDVIIVPNDSLF